jgi:NAD(P)-dependent dehydrogenase (short-subunit alcohol dehydrogenase family)
MAGSEVAFVTGSGRGLGYAIATRLAQAGMAVALHDINEDAPAEFGEHASLTAAAASIAERYGVRTVSVTGNIADENAVAAMATKVEETLSPISVLVNCAGGDIAAKGGKPNPNNALGIKPEDTRAMLERNLLGAIFVCQAVCPGMVERGRGSVVNIGSTAAHLAVDNGIIYAVAKAGVIQFTRCLAGELRPHGIRVNAVSPGPTTTARFLVTRKVDEAKVHADPNSLTRYASPSEIADAVAFLASHESRFVSGQVIRVDGGMHLFAA